jgi:cation transport regulator ChaB
MIQSAFDEDFHPFIGNKISSIQKIYNILKNRQRLDKGNLAKTRIEGAIHPVQMFLQLCRAVTPKEELNRYGSTILDTPSTQSESIPPLFQRNGNAFEALKKAFTDLYPEDFRQLEGIRKEQAPNTAWSQLKATYKKHRKTASTRH